MNTLSYQKVFGEFGFLDNKDNRKEMELGINELFRGIWSLETMRRVAQEYEDAFMKVPKKRAIICQPEQSRPIMQQLQQENPWFNGSDERNLQVLFDWCFEQQVDLTIESARAAVAILKHQPVFYHVPPPPAPAAPPAPPRKKRFDWDSIGDGEIPLVGPDGSEPPEDFLRHCSLEQVRSLVRRRERAAKPWLV